MAESNYLAIRNYIRSDEIMPRFTEILGAKQAESYVNSVLIAVTGSEKLMECSPKSIVISAMRAATLKLSCDPTTKQAHIVPYKGRAQFIIGYKGIYDLAMRTGLYVHINDFIVYQGEIVSQNRMTGMHSVSGERIGDKAIGYMLYFELKTGYKHTFYMTHEEMEEHAKKYSPSFNRYESKFYKDSAWETDFDKMALKTIIRLGLGKYGYFDPHDSGLMNVEANDDADQYIAAMENNLPDYDKVHVKVESEGDIINSLFGPDKNDQKEEECVIEAEIIRENPESVLKEADPEPEAKSKAMPRSTVAEKAEAAVKSSGSRPYAPDKLRSRIDELANSFEGREFPEQSRWAVRTTLENIFGKDIAKRKTVCKYLTGKTSTKHPSKDPAGIEDKYMHALKAWLEADDNLIPSEMSKKEAGYALTAADKENGQMGFDIPAA